MTSQTPTPEDLKKARLLVVGRLVSSIVHEINNPMQAIRGALVLALEEISDPEALRTYITLCQQEADRVIELTNLIRQLYRPENEKLEAIDLNQIVKDAYAIAHDELTRNDIDLKVDPAAKPVLILGVANQIVLILLSILLHLTDTLGKAGSGEIHIHTSHENSLARVAFTLPSGGSPAVFDESAGGRSIAQSRLKEMLDLLSPAYELIHIHHGAIQLVEKPGATLLQLDFPRVDPVEPL